MSDIQRTADQVGDIVCYTRCLPSYENLELKHLAKIDAIDGESITASFFNGETATHIKGCFVNLTLELNTLKNKQAVLERILDEATKVQPMTKKEILHKSIMGMSSYLSCGAPGPYWELVQNLTSEIYGKEGVALINKYHVTYDDSVSANSEIILHSFEGWVDKNTEMTPELIIETLEKLDVVN